MIKMYFRLLTTDEGYKTIYTRELTGPMQAAMIPRKDDRVHIIEDGKPIIDLLWVRRVDWAYDGDDVRVIVDLDPR
jgi:hypothetical protein